MYGSDADTRPACGLHTHRLWQSHADPDRDGYSYSYSDSDSNGDAYADSDYSDTQATSDTATSPIGSNSKTIVRELARKSREFPGQGA